MKVAISISSFYPREAGAERQLREVFARLPRTDWTTVVVARRLPGASADAEVQGIRVRRVGPTGPGRIAMLCYVACAAVAIMRERPDVIVSSQLGAATAAAWIATFVGRRPALAVRLAGAAQETGTRYHQGRPVRGAFLRAVIGSAEAVVTPARHLLDGDGALLILMRQKAHLIPNGAPTLPSCSRETAPFDIDVVWVGRLDPVKAPDDVEAIARLCAGLRFVAIGIQPGTFTAGCGVECLGWLSDVMPVVARARVLISTSRFEGSPNAALEALSAGTPVAAYDIPAFQELAMRYPGAVQVAPLRDVNALAQLVRAMAAAPTRVTVVPPTYEEAARLWNELLHAVVERKANAVLGRAREVSTCGSPS